MYVYFAKNINMKCAVGRCKQNNSKKTTVSFYSFPKDDALRKYWVNFCNRWKTINVKKEKICALHFKSEDFERNLKFELGFSNRRAPKLKPNAVPTIETGTIENGNKIGNKNNISNDSENSNEENIVNEIMDSNLRGPLNEKNEENIDFHIKQEEFEMVQISEMAAMEDGIASDENPSNVTETLNVNIENNCELDQEDFERYLKFEIGPTTEMSSHEDGNKLGNISEIPNEIDIPLKIKQEDIENNLKFKIGSVTTSQMGSFDHGKFPNDEDMEFIPITADIKDKSQLYIQSLEMQIDKYRQEIDTLKMAQIQSAIVKKKLYRQIVSLKYANQNLEKSLRGLFTKGQIKKLKKNGNERQTFSEADIAQSISLYSTSPKAYRLLRDRNFPLPSERTLQRWAHKFNITKDILNSVDEIKKKR